MQGHEEQSIFDQDQKLSHYHTSEEISTFWEVEKKQKRRRFRKTKGKQKGGWASLVAVALPYAVDTIKSIFK